MRMLLQGLNLLIYAVLLPLALSRLVHGRISVGDFLLVTTLMIQLIRNVFDMANGLPDTYDMIGSIRDSLSMLIVPREIRDEPAARELTVPRGEVAFDGVTFAYDAKKPVFAELNLTIRAGQRVGLVGHSGAGKTTLITMLMRLYEVQRGAIRIDGQSIAEVTQASLRRSIGLIPQDVILFHRTLMENIRYGRPGATDAEVLRAADRARAAQERADPGARRGDVGAGQRVRGCDPGRHERSDERKDRRRHRPPAVHARPPGSLAGHRARTDRRGRHPRRPARARRDLRRLVAAAGGRFPGRWRPGSFPSPLVCGGRGLG